MKNVRIKNLRLSNFKGIKEFSISINGAPVVAIAGDNATGKTSLFDGFSWLVTSKDSLGRKDFDIKTITPSGEPVHEIDHEVEACLDIDGQPLTLKKIYKEKNTKRRGEAKKELTGHTTEHFIDDVPLAEKEYNLRLSEVLPGGQALQLLTNPRYFNDLMDWKACRQLLIEVCGDVALEDVIAQDQRLLDLPSYLQGKSVDDLRKILSERKAKINSELKMIPARIDECNKAIKPVTFNEPELFAVRDEIAAAEKALNEQKAGLSSTETAKKIHEIQAMIQAETYKQKAAIQKAQGEKELERNTLNANITAINGEIKGLVSLRGRTKEAIDTGNQDVLKLYTAFDQRNASNYTGETTCPTCKQAMPEAMIHEAQGIFNQNKAAALEKIRKEGKELKAKITEDTAELVRIEKAIETHQKNLDATANYIKRLDAEIAEIKARPIGNDPALMATLAELESQNSVGQMASRDSLDTAQTKINGLKAQERALMEAGQIFAANEYSKARIDQLKCQEHDFNGEFEEVEKQLLATELFIKAKVNLLDEKINAKFKIARFKMFDVQINGGINPCCEVTVNGVPYNSLNNAMRINVGLDIIDTLSKHYGVTLPLFIDNSEAIVNLHQTEAQQIRLIVSAQHQQLTKIS